MKQLIGKPMPSPLFGMSKETFDAINEWAQEIPHYDQIEAWRRFFDKHLHPPAEEEKP